MKRSELAGMVETARFYEQLAHQLAEEAQGLYLQTNGLALQLTRVRERLERDRDALPPRWKFWRRKGR